MSCITGVRLSRHRHHGWARSLPSTAATTGRADGRTIGAPRGRREATAARRRISRARRGRRAAHRLPCGRGRTNRLIVVARRAPPQRSIASARRRARGINVAPGSPRVPTGQRTVLAIPHARAVHRPRGYARSRMSPMGIVMPIGTPIPRVIPTGIPRATPAPAPAPRIVRSPIERTPTARESIGINTVIIHIPIDGIRAIAQVPIQGTAHGHPHRGSAEAQNALEHAYSSPEPSPSASTSVLSAYASESSGSPSSPVQRPRRLYSSTSRTSPVA